MVGHRQYPDDPVARPNPQSGIGRLDASRAGFVRNDHVRCVSEWCRELNRISAGSAPRARLVKAPPVPRASLGEARRLKAGARSSRLGARPDASHSIRAKDRVQRGRLESPVTFDGA